MRAAHTSLFGAIALLLMLPPPDSLDFLSQISYCNSLQCLTRTSRLQTMSGLNRNDLPSSKLTDPSLDYQCSSESQCSLGFSA